MTAGIGQLATGYWTAAAIGAFLVLILLMGTAIMVLRIRRRGRVIAVAIPTTATPDPEPAGTSTADTPSGGPTATVTRPGPATRRPAGNDRGELLITEAVLARERIAGQIDTATYQAHMHDLAVGGRP